MPDLSGRGVFVDRDGVINELVVDQRSGRPESPYRAADVRLEPGAAEALRLLRAAGARIVVVSNQPAAAKGTHERSDLDAVHERVVAQLSEHGVSIDAFRYCFHHPEAVVPDLRGRCDCRKPEPGLVLEAAAELGIQREHAWMIGDSDVDIECGRRAGCRTILIENPLSSHRRGSGVTADLSHPNLLQAAVSLTSGDW